MGLELVADATPRPRAQVYVRYEGPEAACDMCWHTGFCHKRALFVDRRRKRKLCAKCMVKLMDRREAEP